MTYREYKRRLIELRGKLLIFQDDYDIEDDMMLKMLIKLAGEHTLRWNLDESLYPIRGENDGE